MSDDLRVMLRPATAYSKLALADGDSAWTRPLFFSFLIGCVVSLSATGRATVRLVAPATLYAMLIPLVEVALLWVLLRRRSMVPLPRAIDLFFMGHLPWCLWLLSLATMFTFGPTLAAFLWIGWLWRCTTIPALLVWSAYIDYCFFRCVSPGEVGRNLLVHRGVCWTLLLVIFGGGSLWTGLLGILGK
jgi:hypothetical protein